MGCLAPCFGRVEPRRQARKYVVGLMGDLPRNSDFGLADSQVRHYTALHRHLALTMAALAVCATTSSVTTRT